MSSGPLWFFSFMSVITARDGWGRQADGCQSVCQTEHFVLAEFKDQAFKYLRDAPLVLSSLLEQEQHGSCRWIRQCRQYV